MSNLTQDLIKELFHYDPDTGVVTNRISRMGATKGHRAGCANKSDGYLRVGVGGNTYQLHWIIFMYMVGRFPAQEMDHINGDSSDNRWLNLREVSPTINCQNRRMRKDNKSGFTGVGFRKRENRWVSRITVNGIPKSLGYYEEFDDAVAERKKANIKYGFHENHGRVN